MHPYNAKQPLLQHLHDGIPPLDGQTLPESRQKIKIFSWSEAWNLPTCGCKSMVEGLTIMLGVFINLLYTHTMPNNHYCSTYMMAYPHLMAKHCLRVGRKSRFFPWSEAWNLPTCGCKSMVEGLTIMLGVFINLLYTHTMPNNHYCSTYMMAYPHLMAKHWLRVGRKSRFFPDLRHETCLHVAVKVWWRDLQSCWECSSTCYTPIQCQTTTIAAPTWWHTPTWWPNIAWKSAENQDFSWSEAWNLPTCGCKSMMEWTYNHAGSVHQLVIHPYNAKQPLLQHLHDGIPPLDGQTLESEKIQSAENQDLDFPHLRSRHETCLHVAVKVCHG